MSDDTFIGDKIRKLREAKGLTALALQRRTGLSQATLYRAEVGGVVTGRTARKLANVLGCSLRELTAQEPGGQHA